jgi:protein-disulfide isomerase
MSKREERRKRRESQTRQRQLIVLGVIVILAVAATGYLIYQNSRPIGEIVTVPTQTFALANGKTMGEAEAPVTILLFSDFQCPGCGNLARNLEDQLIEAFVNTGQARLEYRHFLIVDQIVGGTESREAAEASECANEQGQFWNYHDTVFANQQGEGQGAFADRRLKAFAEAMGLDTAAFNACFDSNRFASAVQADHNLGVQMGVSGTPTVFLNSYPMENPNDFSEYQRVIEAQSQQ